jgi:hypothetical protein
LSLFASHSPLHRNALLACGSVLVLAACGSGDDGVDAGLADGKVADAIQPPDFSAADAGLQGNIGQPCNVSTGSGCTGHAKCLALTATDGICAIPDCTLEDTTTPTSEDTCPAEAACAGIPVESAGGPTVRNFCLPRCLPDADEKTCAPLGATALACDPLSILLTGHTEVCAVVACTRGEDCGEGMRCHEPSGVCLLTGQAGVKVGDPCSDVDDCGPDQFCLPERKHDGQVRLAGGYCTVVGCKYEGPWSCPEGSECIGLGSEEQAMTLCLALCDLASNSPQCREGYDCLEVDSVGVCWLDLIP